jgi:TonB-dependent SusC/RagA subfamily outer membrane receptor
MKNIIIFCVFLTVSSITGLYAQKAGKKTTITGYVRDVAAIPVPDAVIIIDGEKTQKYTDGSGFYKIKVRSDAKKIGVFITAGGTIQEEIGGRESIDFTFKISIPYNKTVPGDEQVNIGYGSVKKKNLSGPVGNIDATKSKYSGYNNVYDLIRGEVPGVVVSGSSIMIRSNTSLNSSNEPLFVVDGVPVSTIDNIHPLTIKSIQVLKGSDASIYGSRGSNGVILINLLKGNDK